MAARPECVAQPGAWRERQGLEAGGSQLRHHLHGASNVLRPPSESLSNLVSFESR